MVRRGALGEGEGEGVGESEGEGEKPWRFYNDLHGRECASETTVRRARLQSGEAQQAG